MSPDDSIDLTGVPCPTNASRALIRLEGMDPGEILEILLDAGEPLENVPRSVVENGHTLLHQEPHAGGWRLLVRCQ